MALAEDAVTYAVRDTGAPRVPATYAPKNLTLAQLKKIFLCKDTTWGQVGGTKAADQGLPAAERFRHPLVLA